MTTLFQTVPGQFFTDGASKCEAWSIKMEHPMEHQNLHKTTQYVKNLFGCHCIETTGKCRRILWFLTLTGRFSIKETVQILYRTTLTSNGWRFTGSFEDLIHGIVYPIFDERFSNKYEHLKLHKSFIPLYNNNYLLHTHPCTRS